MTQGLKPNLPSSHDLPEVRKTFCRICVGFCGLKVTTDGERIHKIEADQNHLYNWKDFCHKGKNAERIRTDPRRITRPMKRVGDRYVEASYEEAISDIARRLKRIRDQHGPHAIGGYIGNPGASNSSASLFHNAFMQSVGSANNYYVSSIDQNSLHLVSRRMYGSEVAMLIPDIDNADCIMLIGANPAVSVMGWVDSNINGWKRIKAKAAAGMDLIVVDPHVTATSADARTHLQVRPGQDWALLLAMLSYIFEHGLENKPDCADATNIEPLRYLAGGVDREDLARRCGLSLELIEDVARRFATAKTGFCVTRTGVAMNRNGTLGEWMGHALNLVCGRIDRKGGRYFQPGVFKNSMKVLNDLAKPQPRPSRIGGHRQIAGAYPLAILADEINTPGQDQVRAMIIYGGNPVVAGAEGDKLDEAFSKLDLLVSVDLYQRESHRHADWLIPAQHYLEREDLLAFYGMIFEKPFVQFAQPVVRAPDDIAPDWRFYLDVALAMGIPFMGVKGLNTVVRISRWLARLTGRPKLAFGPRWIWAGLIKAQGVVRWKDVVNSAENGLYYRDFEMGCFRSLLQTPDGKINAAPDEFVYAMRQRLAEVEPTNAAYPYLMISQRRRSMMNSWLAEFNDHKVASGDVIEVNQQDAEREGWFDWQRLRVSSGAGSLEVYARVTDEVPPGVVCMEHGWGSRLFDPNSGTSAKVTGVRRNTLVAADVIDELTGTPNLNGSPVSVMAVDATIATAGGG